MGLVRFMLNQSERVCGRKCDSALSLHFAVALGTYSGGCMMPALERWANDIRYCGEVI